VTSVHARIATWIRWALDFMSALGVLRIDQPDRR
jgi:hypothetical protein